MNDSVTVITITRRRPELLARAIQSIQQQDFDQGIKHLIIVDDCEKTTALLENSYCKLKQIQWFKHSRRHNEVSGPGRLGYLRNVAIQISTSKWMAFLDDDNMFEVNHISSLVEKARRTGLQSVHSYRQLFYRDGKPFLEQRSPWRRNPQEGRFRYAELQKKGVFVEGSNVMKDRVDPKGSSNPVRTVDTSEWLINRDLLIHYPFSEIYSYHDWKTRNTEDKKFLQQLVDHEIPIGCTHLATLRYFLGGYSNSSGDSEDIWNPPAQKF